MNRCQPAATCRCAPFRARHVPVVFSLPCRFLRVRRLLLAGLAGGLLAALGPANAQVPAGMGLSRPFPEKALRGTLLVTSTADARLNGQPIRMAPGMRLFSPQNTLVMAHTVLGQPFKVNYVLEHSTGMLLTAWILTEGEAAQPRKASESTVTTNIITGSGVLPR